MGTYSKSFENAVSHAMFYEVGGFWREDHPAVERGLIDTRENRKAVGYVNDPNDHGGETKFGVARNANADLDITHLTWEQAKAVYYVRYWIAGKCDQLPPRLAVLHFDGCVNHGINRANMFLQRACGVQPDGKIGPVTIAKAKALPIMALLGSVCTQREQFYKAIVVNDPSQSKYLTGWLRRITEMRAYVTRPENTFV